MSILADKTKSLVIDGQEIQKSSDIVEVYEKRLHKYGFSGRTLLYSDEELHKAKITQYATLIHRIWKEPVSVLDVGCGYGSLVPFLPPCNYTGIDLVPEFVKEAKRRFPNLRFEVCDIYNISERFDWVLLLGITGSVPYPQKLAEKAWELAKVGLIVDFIDANRYHGDLNRFDIGSCVELFLNLGAGIVEVHRVSGYNWVILVVYREDLWLNNKK